MNGCLIRLNYMEEMSVRRSSRLRINMMINLLMSKMFVFWCKILSMEKVFDF
jgi:hypothetical protein